MLCFIHGFKVRGSLCATRDGGYVILRLALAEARGARIASRTEAIYMDSDADINLQGGDDTFGMSRIMWRETCS